MSSVDKIIDKIAGKAFKSKHSSALEAYFYINLRCCPPLSDSWERRGLDWELSDSPSFPGILCGVAPRPSQEKIDELNQIMVERNHYPPSLSDREIRDITSCYPLHLPQEIYHLYQRANGMFPLGLGDKDWKSFDNYFFFDIPEYSESFLPLHEAVEMYKLRFSSSSINHMFPLLSFENGSFLACKGKKTPCTTSPIYLVFDSYEEEPDFLWASLADMLSTALKNY